LGGNINSAGPREDFEEVFVVWALGVGRVFFIAGWGDFCWFFFWGLGGTRRCSNFTFEEGLGWCAGFFFWFLFFIGRGNYVLGGLWGGFFLSMLGGGAWEVFDGFF